MSRRYPSYSPNSIESYKTYTGASKDFVRLAVSVLATDLVIRVSLGEDVLAGCSPITLLECQSSVSE